MSVEIDLMAQNTNIEDVRNLIQNSFPDEVLEFYEEYLGYLYSKKDKDDLNFESLVNIDKKYIITEKGYGGSSEVLLKNKRHSPVKFIPDDNLNEDSDFNNAVKHSAKSLSYYLFTGKDYDEWKRNYKELQMYQNHKEGFSVSMILELDPVSDDEEFTYPRIIVPYSDS